ncbi:MAG: hypothetical protein C5B49_08235 [Bdellovibrio sp.]|nr:MAG: hypothetical protein C5B49_08235 [Bdellovibrio sp.]
MFVFALGLLALSFWLMFHTFYILDGQLMISEKIWSDYGAHIPLIRSFSFGKNWPPEYPIYPGPPIQYHFLFYYFVALMEKSGWPLDLSLNFLSGLGFFAMVFGLYVLGTSLYSDRRVGFLAVIFFLLNGSLAFFSYFQKHPIRWQSFGADFRDLLHRSDFTAMGPWDGGPVIGFWNLNVYLNQRHFVLALGILLLFLACLIRFEEMKPKLRWLTTLLFTVLFGIMPLLNKPVCLMAGLFAATCFIGFPKMRRHLAVLGGGVLAFMAAEFFFGLNVGGDGNIKWYVGFTSHNQGFWSAVQFWIWNWGLHVFLIPIGFYLAPRRVKIMLFPIFPLFALSVLVKLSAEILNNHKLFNLVLMLGGILSAASLVCAYDRLKHGPRTWLRPLRFAGLPIVLLMTLSGIVDVTAIVNDHAVAIADVEMNPAANWLLQNTQPNDVVLNSSYMYHPASLAGRKIFVGWSFFVFSAGYDFSSRARIAQTIYSSRSPDVFCPLLQQNRIAYLTVEDTSQDRNLPPIDHLYFSTHFTPEYSDARMAIYATARLCGPVASAEVPRAPTWAVPPTLRGASSNQIARTEIYRPLAALQLSTALYTDRPACVF